MILDMALSLFYKITVLFYFLAVIGVVIFGLASTTMQRNILSHLTPAEKQGI